MSEHVDNAGWNAWWHQNFRNVMDEEIIESVGWAMGEIRKELRDEIRELRTEVTKLKRELAAAREDGTVALPRSAWKYDHVA